MQLNVSMLLETKPGLSYRRIEMKATLRIQSASNLSTDRLSMSCSWLGDGKGHFNLEILQS